MDYTSVAMDFKNKMLLYMLCLVLFQTASSQFRETSTSRILKRLDTLEDNVLVLKEERDLCKEDIFTLSEELRILRKDFDEERKLRRSDIPTVSNRLTVSSEQVVSLDKEQVAIPQHGSCDCDDIVSQYKHVMNAFKSEKSENLMLRKKFDEIRKEHDFEMGNVREIFNNVISRLNSTDKTLRSEINKIQNETKENLSAAQKLVHDSYVVCQKEVNDARAYFNDGFMRVNESLTNHSLNALHELSEITSDIAKLKTSNEILKNLNNVLTSCDSVEKGGEYKIYPSSHPNGIRVYCYKDSTKRGWIVIQRRADLSVNLVLNIDECVSTPCRNGGTCQDNSDGFTCTCLSGYTGTSCETDINECSSSPCRNGATCNDQVNHYTCGCAPGYSGPTCASDVNKCYSNPCSNGSTCVDQVTHFVCVCAAGYSGATCDSDVNECSSNPCTNGGTCVDQVNQFVCVCAAGYSGSTCALDVNECTSNPCTNNGTCVDQVNKFVCVCAPGYSGATCALDIDECVSTPCRNGGTCQDNSDGFTCTCLSGYTGISCETFV